MTRFYSATAEPDLRAEFIGRSGSDRRGRERLDRSGQTAMLAVMAGITTRLLSIADAHRLAPLVAAYVQDRKRGAPRPPDEFYAELLLNDRAAELMGAELDGRMVGFAVFFDLPDTMTGMRVGQLDDLFVIQDARGKRVGHAIVAALTAEGAKRGWSSVRWMVPEKPAAARRLAEQLAEPGGLASFAIRIVSRR
jgi:GNAT superfamily N-acetyltransferase